MHGKNLTVGYRNGQPGIFFYPNKKEVEGYDIDILKALARKFKFKYTLKWLEFEIYSKEDKRFNKGSANYQVKLGTSTFKSQF